VGCFNWSPTICSVSFSVLDGENEISNATFGKYSFNAYHIAKIFHLYFQLSITSIVVVHGLKKFYNVNMEYDFTFYVMKNQKICNCDSLNCSPNCAFTQTSCKSYTKHSFVIYNTIYVVQLICNYTQLLCSWFPCQIPAQISAWQMK
jgi:hypothetical protein